MGTTAIVIAIGNSDDKISQREWSELWALFHDEIAGLARYAGVDLHGVWHSAPNSRYQNASWSISIDDDMLVHTRSLKTVLQEFLWRYEQDTMAWTTGRTELVPAADPPPTRGTCGVCEGRAYWVECPTGGWWAHVRHPLDNHDAEVEKEVS